MNILKAFILLQLNFLDMDYMSSTRSAFKNIIDLCIITKTSAFAKMTLKVSVLKVLLIQPFSISTRTICFAAFASQAKKSMDFPHTRYISGHRPATEESRCLDVLRVQDQGII